MVGVASVARVNLTDQKSAFGYVMLTHTAISVAVPI